MVFSGIMGLIFSFLTVSLIEFSLTSKILASRTIPSQGTKSPFDKNNMDLIVNTTISTKYKDREDTIEAIIEITDALTSAKNGNHIVFFPSYKYMELFINKLDISKYNIVIQKPDMTEADRLWLKEVGLL